MFVASLSYAQLTNIATPYDSITEQLYLGRAATNIIQFYKFLVTPAVFSMTEYDPGSPPFAGIESYDAYPGGTIYIKATIHNVGSIDDINGIKLISSSVPGATITLCSNNDINTAILNNNIGPLNSGQIVDYYIFVTIPQNYTGDDPFNFSITNIGSTNTGPHPYIFIANYEIDVIHQTITIPLAEDGINRIVGNKNFDGSQALGNLNAKIFVKLDGEITESSIVKLYYDVNTAPDGTTPDGTVDKNRAITLIKETIDGVVYWVGTIPITDEEIQPGSYVNFIVSVDGKIYDNLGEPWKYQIREYAAEGQPESEHTDSVNNIFDPEKGEKYYLVYKLNRKSFVNISIYSIRGELVKQLKHEIVDIGRWKVEWNGRNDTGKRVAMGLYFVNIETAEYGDTRKVIVILR